MHDREIILIAALGGLIWLTLAAARTAGRADQATEAAETSAPCIIPDQWHWALWEDELQPQRPVYDWESDGL